MTAQDAFAGEQQTVGTSMQFHSFNCIVGAAWIKTALGAHDRAYQQLVAADQQQDT
jgi:hypothetical protein